MISQNFKKPLTVLPRGIYYYLEAALSFLYPAFCGLCEKALDLDEKKICFSCSQALNGVRFSYMKSLGENSLEPFDSVWTAYPYEEPVNRLILAAKFHRMGWLLDAALDQCEGLILALSSESHYDAVVPVPLHRWKRFQREFNQAEKIAEKVNHYSGLPVVNALYKKSKSQSQTSLSQKERLFNLMGSFRASKQYADFIKGKHLLLVDDVLTTGATAQECARVLKSAGAAKISLFTLARTAGQS